MVEPQTRRNGGEKMMLDWMLLILLMAGACLSALTLMEELGARRGRRVAS